VASAVILNPEIPVSGLDDSKKLSAARRETLSASIMRTSLAWSLAWADVAEIDCLNILQASMLAMRRAVFGLRLRPALLEIDGNCLPDLDFAGEPIPGNAIIGGDARVQAISAASILAKVHRDSVMRALEEQYPGYGFAQHKGYATAGHRAALERLGPCPEHRCSFHPVAAIFARNAKRAATHYNRVGQRACRPHR